MHNSKYKTFFYSSGDYECQVLCLSYASLYSFIDDVQSELKSNHIINAHVLFDQLLITGNNNNRFLSIDMNNGKLHISTARAVTGDKLYKEFTASYLRKQNVYLINSVLTNSQRKLIEQGCTI